MLALATTCREAVQALLCATVCVPDVTKHRMSCAERSCCVPAFFPAACAWSGTRWCPPTSSRRSSPRPRWPRKQVSAFFPASSACGVFTTGKTAAVCCATVVCGACAPWYRQWQGAEAVTSCSTPLPQGAAALVMVYVGDSGAVCDVAMDSRQSVL